MNKERIFYLDFVRAIATLIIILTHYNALYIYNTYTVRYDAMIFSAWFSNVYIGHIGVGLFLIISGAALLYQEEDKTGIFRFYKKRFLSIYPMYWLAYILAFFYMFYTTKTIIWNAPKANIIYSVFGIDMYVANFGVSTFAIVGEWFIGLIIMIYLIFPILKKGVLHKPLLTCTLVAIAYVISICTLNLSVGLFEWLPAFVFGMIFLKYIKKMPGIVAAIAIAIIILNGKLNIMINENVMRLYIVIAVFCVLVYVAKLVERFEIVRRICKLICKYSYPCFLVHHFIIYRICETFDLNSISRTRSLILFVLCCMVIYIGSVVLDRIYNRIKLFGEKKV